MRLTKYMPITATLNWVILLLAIVFNVQWIGLAVALSDAMAALSYYQLALVLPANMRTLMRGLALGMSVLCLAELVLFGQGIAGVSLGVLQEVLFFIGTSIFAVHAFSLPKAMVELGLYPHNILIKSVLYPISAGIGVTAAMVMLWVPTITPITFYTASSFSLLFLFVYQSMLMSHNRLHPAFVRIMWALVLVSVARIVGIAGGVQPPLWASACFGIFWVAGMHVVAMSKIKVI